MKRLMIAMSLFVLTSIFVFASDENTFSLNERGRIDCYGGTVTISPETAEIFLGREIVYVIRLENQAMEWTAVSSDANIAVLRKESDSSWADVKRGTGDNNLHIRAEGCGTCVITFTRLDNNETETIVVTVIE